jgi:hypothetical protein
MDRTGKCIFCLASSEHSKRRAHVVPEALMANEVVLPVGVECDSCNEHLSDVESALIHHNRIWLPIILNRVPGKAGRLRKGLGQFEVTYTDGEIHVQANLRDEDIVRRDDGKMEINMSDPPQYDDLKFRRGLFAIGLRYIVLKLGQQIALEPRFDSVRSYVRAPKRGASWKYVQVPFPDTPIRNQLRIHFVDGAPGLTVRLRSFVDDFYLDVLNTGELAWWAKHTVGMDAALI